MDDNSISAGSVEVIRIALSFAVREGRITATEYVRAINEMERY